LRTTGLVIALGHGREGFVELSQLEGFPVFLHVVRNIGEVVEEVALAVAKDFQNVFAQAVSEYGFEECSILGLNNTEDLFSTFKECLQKVSGEVVVTAPANAPLIPVDILALLVELCEKRDAVLVRDVKGGVDWLLSAYNRRSFMDLVEARRPAGFEELVDGLRRVMYIAHSGLKDIDPLLLTNIRVTRASDIPFIEKLLKGVRRGR
jgi:molybdopterin-guanine dinucleotide biosynthesis protein A